jgi:hypothetical protein
MPNWCKNRLVAVNPTKAFGDFIKHRFSFDKIDPMPKELLNEGWHDWRGEHWGTKWDLREEDKFEGNEIWFSTAWAAPIPVIAKLSKMFPTVRFELTYYEGGIGYAGSTKFVSGNVSDVYTTNPIKVKRIGQRVFGIEPEEED